jgi:hypothetical protein
METQTKKMMKALKGTLSRASAGAMLALSLTGCSDLELKIEPKSNGPNSRTMYEQRQLEEQEAFRQRESQTAQARIERRRVNYDSPQTFTNANGSIDKYFPIEDLLYNGSHSWQIFYTDKDTQKLKGQLFYDAYRPEVVRDLATNQTPFAEVINYSLSKWRFNVDRTLIHIRKNDRIKGGTMYIPRAGNQQARTIKLETIDLEGKAEGNNGN